MNNYLGFTTKGLEFVSEQELNALKELKVTSKSEKTISFSYDNNPKDLLKLKTFDDIILLESNALKNNIENITSQNLKRLKEVISELRLLNNTFSITFTYYKSQIADKESFEQNYINQIARETNWEYTPRERNNLDFRVLVENDKVTFGVRLGEQSLHHRFYKQDIWFGSLKPTIAACMVELCKFSSGSSVVDNFCGSGTILCEAFLKDLKVAGGDIMNEAVEITKKSLNLCGNNNPDIILQNGTRTKWRDNEFDSAISNLPWNVKVKSDHLNQLYKNAISEYDRIVKIDGIICLLGTLPKLMVSQLKKLKPNNMIETYEIGFYGQSPTIVISKPS
ncbi:MAG TPA: N-6 DNA methylase [Candidatus Dojkabacteria bacterium]|nr:N-6 DNA methylase [Candidatus Dojkabacteria bacterium]